MLADTVGYNRIYARVDLDNIRYNIERMKAQVKPGMKCLIVIKADAYGHGAVVLADKLADLADYYGVAAIDEAVELRNAGVTKPILIIGYTDCEDYEKLIAYNVTQAVYDAGYCRQLSELALKHKCRVKVHIKVDTGMSRIGFPVSGQGVEEALSLKDMHGLDIEGIFTHYAKADEVDKSSAYGQKDKFLYFIDQLEKNGMSFSLKHIDNSAGTMELDDNEFDMVRLGIVTYGLYPSKEVDTSVVIKPAMSLIAHVAHIKTVPEGTGVSYGWTYYTKRETVLATVTAGYADGYPRALTNIGRVIIHGHYAPIVGRVCMDQFMVDVTDIPGVFVRDEVILMGSDGPLNISAEEISAPANSFNYELVCNVARRVPRVYREHGRDVMTLNYLL